MNDEVVEDAGLMGKGYLYVSLDLQSVLGMAPYSILFSIIPEERTLNPPN